MVTLSKRITKIKASTGELYVLARGNPGDYSQFPFEMDFPSPTLLDPVHTFFTTEQVSIFWSSAFNHEFRRMARGPAGQGSMLNQAHRVTCDRAILGERRASPSYDEA